MNSTVRPMTYDALALEILMSSAPGHVKDARLAALYAAAEKADEGGPCPDCGNSGPHEDNGRSGSERSFCCIECGTHWDARKA